MRGYVKVDQSDVALLSKYEWRLFTDKLGRPYAYRRDETGRRVWMHREILGLAAFEKDEHEVDHENRDTLDNRRSNLRVATHAENMQNRKSHRGSTSRHRGVYRNVGEERWRAQVVVSGRAHKLGTYATEEEASEVVKTFRARHMPFSDEAGASRAMAS